MKLKNKKTGEIGELTVWRRADNDEATGFAVIKKNEKFPTDYNSLAELNEEWEDMSEEPKDYWYIYAGKPQRADCGGILEEDFKAIGNYFSSRAEAEKAVEKLEAFKRLKDKGFRFERWVVGGEYGNTITFSDYIEYNDETRADLDLLFGGEE